MHDSFDFLLGHMEQ